MPDKDDCTPILRPTKNGKFHIIRGHRRLDCFQPKQSLYRKLVDWLIRKTRGKRPPV